MNRTGIFAAALLVCFLLVAPVEAQVALVVGSIRDQHGTAVEGASVLGLNRAGARVAAAATDASGTFAMPATGGGGNVVIACTCVQRNR